MYFMILSHKIQDTHLENAACERIATTRVVFDYILR